MRISDWSSDVCSSDLIVPPGTVVPPGVYFSLSEALAWIGSRNEALCNAVRWFQRRPERQDAAGHESLYNRSEENTSELQSLMRISYAVFCLKKKKKARKETHIERRITITYAQYNHGPKKYHERIKHSA